MCFVIQRLNSSSLKLCTINNMMSTPFVSLYECYNYSEIDNRVPRFPWFQFLHCEHYDAAYSEITSLEEYFCVTDPTWLMWDLGMYYGCTTWHKTACSWSLWGAQWYERNDESFVSGYFQTIDRFGCVSVCLWSAAPWCQCGLTYGWEHRYFNGDHLPRVIVLC